MTHVHKQTNKQTHPLTHTQTHDQRSVGSKDRGETNGRTDGRTLLIALPFWLTRLVNIREKKTVFVDVLRFFVTDDE